MNRQTFDELVKTQLQKSEEVLTTKGNEYALGVDRLDHFKKSAILMNCSVKQAIFNMLVKHLISISDMVSSEKKFDDLKWDEKIIDSINYLLILRAAIEETNDETH